MKQFMVFKDTFLHGGVFRVSHKKLRFQLLLGHFVCFLAIFLEVMDLSVKKLKTITSFI